MVFQHFTISVHKVTLDKAKMTISNIKIIQKGKIMNALYYWLLMQFQVDKRKATPIATRLIIFVKLALYYLRTV